MLKSFRKFYIIAGIFIILMIGGVIFWRQSGKEELSPTDSSSGFMIGQSAIYVAEQLPGRNVSVAVVRFEKPGFVAVHEEAYGAPGNILGVSSLFPAGEFRNPSPIVLSREIKDGEIIYVMLHLDNGDGKFDARGDQAVLDAVSGEPVTAEVLVSEDAVGPGVINP